MCALRNKHIDGVRKDSKAQNWNQRFSLLYGNDLGIDHTKTYLSESDSDEEEDIPKNSKKVSDLRNLFLEKFNSDDTSTTSYITQTSVSSSQKFRKDSKTIVTRFTSHTSTSSRTTTVTSKTDRNFNNNFQTPTAVLPIIPRSSPQTSPKNLNRGTTPGSPKEFKPRKVPPTSNGNSRSDIIAKRKQSTARTHEPTSVELNEWNRKYTQPKTFKPVSPRFKALETFKMLESQGTPSPSSSSCLGSNNRDPFSFPFGQSRNSMGSTVSTDRSSIGSMLSETTYSVIPEDQDVSTNTPKDTYCDVIISESIPKEVRVEVEETPKTKVFNIATELLTTEREYVRVLGLIEMFRSRVEKGVPGRNGDSDWADEGCAISQDDFRTMFSNSEAIYKFHNDFLLPQLEKRMKEWQEDCGSNQKIGDIFKTFGPYLILYAEYIKDFEKGLPLINDLYTKNNKLRAVMDEIHAQPECGNLTLSNHMLVIIQRIPRYEMLFKDYLKKLSEDSPDRHESEQALEIIKKAAIHSNEALNKIKKFKEILEVEKKLGHVLQLVSPTRQLLKEGDLHKISRTDSEHHIRHIYLFNDMLLMCAKRGLGDVLRGEETYKLKGKYPLDQMNVVEIDSIEADHTFFIRDDSREVILYAGTEEEKDEWLDALYIAIRSYFERINTLNIGTKVVGKEEPKFEDSTTAKSCSMDKCVNTFKFFNKGCNCKSCGKVFCSKCIKNKIYVPYLQKEEEVCGNCFEILEKQNPPEATMVTTKRDDKKDEIIYNGELQFRSCIYDQGKVKSGKAEFRHCVLKGDYTLHLYKSKKDKTADKILPVPGNIVHHGDEELKTDSVVLASDRKKIIKMCHPQMLEIEKKSQFFSDKTEKKVVGGGQGTHDSLNRIYYFYSAIDWQAERWSRALKLAQNAKEPDDDFYKLNAFLNL